MYAGNRSGEIDSKCYQRFSLSEIIVDLFVLLILIFCFLLQLTWVTCGITRIVLV